MAGLVARAALFIFTLLGVRAGRVQPDNVYPSLKYEYNETEAKEFAYLSQAAFCTQTSVEKWDCGVSCEETKKPERVIFIAEGMTHEVPGFVAKLQGKGRCVVSFRGSVTLRNWRADFAGWRTSWPSCDNCSVHWGFAKAYQEIRQPVVDALLALSCTRVVFTGHSLGGAIATLAAADVLMHDPLKVEVEGQEEDMKVEALWTYGKPRIGNAAFVQAFFAAAEGVRLWRVVHYNDPVTRLPPRRLGFLHEPTAVYYTSRYDKHGENRFKICHHGLDGREAWSLACAGMFLGHNVLNLDHLTYLGIPFDFKNADPKCKVERSMNPTA